MNRNNIKIVYQIVLNLPFVCGTVILLASQISTVAPIFPRSFVSFGQSWTNLKSLALEKVLTDEN